MALATAAGGAEVAQTGLAVSTGFVQSSAASVSGTAQGWNTCVTRYIRQYSAHIQDPDEAADDAFSACRTVQVPLNSGAESRPLYGRDDGSRQAIQSSSLKQDVRMTTHVDTDGR